MKLSSKIAIGIAAIVAAGVGGNLAYRASVHEQNCLSYEKQILVTTDAYLEKVKGTAEVAERAAKTNLPDGGLADFLTTQFFEHRENFLKEKNHIKYAHIKTCGQKRYEKFADGKQNMAKVDEVNKIATKLMSKLDATPRTPQFDANRAWNSDASRAFLEHQIKTNMINLATRNPINVATASCSPQTTANFWSCHIRELGSSYGYDTRIEVNPVTGDWQSH